MMRHMSLSALVSIVCLSAPTSVFAQPAAGQPAAARPQKTAQVQKTIALVGGRVLGGGVLGAQAKEATVIIEGDRIVRVEAGLAAPAGATVIDAKGKIITAGLVDPLTSIGLVEIDLEETSRNDEDGKDDPIRAGFRAIDGFNSTTSVIGVARAQGLTSAGVIPTGGLFSGQSAWADLDGAAGTSSIARAPMALHVHLGARAVDGGHASAILRVREAFDDAREFSRRRAAWERNQTREFAPSRLDLEAMVLALSDKVPVVFHVDRAADILSALAVAREFGLRAVIARGLEAWRVADELAAARVPVIAMPLVNVPLTFDGLAARADSPALLHAAGVQLALSTGKTHQAGKLRQAAGNAVRAGLPYDAAIRAITRGAADIFGLGAQYGTVEPNKIANVVVWSGDPLELSSHAEAVFIRGRQVDLKNRHSALLKRYRHLE